MIIRNLRIRLVEPFSKTYMEHDPNKGVNQGFKNTYPSKSIKPAKLRAVFIMTFDLGYMRHAWLGGWHGKASV